MKTLRQYWLLAALLLLATAWSVRLVEDIDVQWHLRIGKWMCENRRVVREDFFSVSKWGREWTSVPWLYQCIMAWLVDRFGWLGPTVWQWLAALAVTVQTAFLVWLYRRRGTVWDWRWPALSVPAALFVGEALRAAEIRFMHRPEMNSYVLIGTFLILLTLRRQGRVRRAVFLLPLLQVWWVNTHGVFALGPILVWTFIGAEWLDAVVRTLIRLRRRAAHRPEPGAAQASQTAEPAAPPAAEPALDRAAWKNLFVFTAAGALVLLACFFSPYGRKAALYPFHLFYVLTDPTYKFGISEGIPVSVRGMWRDGGWNLVLLFEWALALFGGLARAVHAFTRGWRDAPPHGDRVAAAWTRFHAELGAGYLIVCAGFLHISLTAIRNVPLFSVVAAPLAVSGAEYLLDAVRWPLERWRPASARWVWTGSRVAGRLALAAFLVWLYRAIVSERYYEHFHRGQRFAIGQSDHSFPVAGMRFLEQHLPNMARVAMFGDTKSADMFLNRFGPEWKTYIDGRHAEVYDAPFFRQYGETLGIRGPFFLEAAKYSIGLVVLCVQDMPGGQSELARDIYRHPGWSLIYLDDCAAIFAAHLPASAPVIARFALPPAPAPMDEQQVVYQQWLGRTGRRFYDLYEPANAVLDTRWWVQGLLTTLQLGGLWRPIRNRAAWQASRTAAFLSRLGWPAVADNIYEAASNTDPVHSVVMQEAVNHAIACFEACQTPPPRAFFMARLRHRCDRLAKYEPGHVTAQYGLAYWEYHNDRALDAAVRLEALSRARDDVAIIDLLAMAYGDLGDAARSTPEKTRLWKKAVRAWRRRLTRHPAGPGVYRAYLRLGDLFLRLEKPLLARANYVAALNEPGVPPAIAERARNYVRSLETTLYGGTFVPGPDALPESPGPFGPPPGP
ncbi:MAG: hypothetical protein JXR37_05985 [Kiritimatiellae bacterium]|nr:hypothetical protein [Kiritimatiellia bacterium]